MSGQQHYELKGDALHRLVASCILLYIGVCGNIAVLISLMNTWKRNTRAHFFVACLSAAEILGVACHLGTDIAWTVHINWTAGDNVCKLVMFLYRFGHITAHYVLASFNCDNVAAVVSNKTKNVRCCLIITSIIVAVCGCIPEAVVYSVQEYGLSQYIPIQTCSLFGYFSSADTELIYMGIRQVVIFWLPLLLIMFTWIPSVTLWFKKRGTTSLERAKEFDQNSIKTIGADISMATAFNIAFILCWMPGCLYEIITWFSTHHYEVSRSVKSQSVTQTLIYVSMSNSSLNALIYGMYMYARFDCERSCSSTSSKLTLSMTIRRIKELI